MITDFLLKKFVPEYTGKENAASDQEMRKKIGTLGSATGMVLNILLSVMKMLLGFFIGSVAITADGVNNLSDAGGSLVALVSVRMAQKPQDEDHPFGHGRIEYLGALVVGVLIAFFGVELIKSGVESIIAGKPSAFSVLSFVLLVIGVVVKGWMSVFYRRLGKMSDNPTLLAAAKDSMGDAVSTTVITAATLVSHVTGWPLDGYAGVLVALHDIGKAVLAVLLARMNLSFKPTARRRSVTRGRRSFTVCLAASRTGNWAGRSWKCSHPIPAFWGCMIW